MAERDTVKVPRQERRTPSISVCAHQASIWGQVPTNQQPAYIGQNGNSRSRSVSSTKGQTLPPHQSAVSKRCSRVKKVYLMQCQLTGQLQFFN